MEELICRAMLKIKRKDIILSSEQKRAIISVFSGKDTIVCLPTGHGKSIVFEIVPWCYTLHTDKPGEETVESEAVESEAVSVVLVVSPLLALMNKQVEDLITRGLSAVRLGSDLTSSAKESLERGEITYVFASPESLQTKTWRQLLLSSPYQSYLKAVFIDEAHCVDMWGSGNEPFRRCYHHLGELRSLLPNNVPFCALTATASKNTREHIEDSLCLSDVTMISLSPNRNNITYHVVRVDNFLQSCQWIIEELRLKGNSTPKKVIYCQSIENCSKLYQHFDMALCSDGYVTPERCVHTCLFAMYHAKITDSEKSGILHSFAKVDGTCRVLFATIAFGMGVNISDIHMVIHFGPSQNIEAYVQECGRAGRD